MSAFQIHQGLTSFINRLELEVNLCRKEQPFEIVIPGTVETMPDADEVAETAEPQTSASTSEAGASWRNPNQDENPYSGSRESDDMAEDPTPSASGESSGVRWTQPELTSSSSSQKSSEPNHDSDYTVQTPPSTSRDAASDVSQFGSFTELCCLTNIFFFFNCRSRWKKSKKTMRHGCPR